MARNEGGLICLNFKGTLWKFILIAVERVRPWVGRDPPTIGPLAPGQRWSVARKREVVLRLLRGESVELLSRELGVPIYKLEQWREKADAALEGALKERESDPVSVELAAAMQRVGELSMEVELLRARIGRPGPLARRRSR
jgi:transposase